MKRNTVILILVALVVALMLWTAARYHRAGLPQVGADASGAPAPDFELKSLDGRTVRLSDFRGKAVLLNFWATWCAPCKIEMPWFVDLKKQYGAQGLEVIGVAMDDAGEDKIADFAKQMNIDYLILMGKDKVGEDYGGVQFLPTTFFIDRQGRIVERVFGLVGYKEIEDNVKKALGGAAQASASPNPSGEVAAKQ